MGRSVGERHEFLMSSSTGGLARRGWWPSRAWFFCTEVVCLCEDLAAQVTMSSGVGIVLCEDERLGTKYGREKSSVKTDAVGAQDGADRSGTTDGAVEILGREIEIVSEHGLANRRRRLAARGR